jgi:Peptidase A4 family
MNGTGNESPKDAQDTREALGVRLFKQPPENFDPVKASDRELLVYGYPGRPDLQRHPELHEHWERMVSRPMSIIDPQFAVTPGRRLSRGRAVADLVGTDQVGGLLPMAGCIQGPSATLGVTETFVSGQWTVPDVVVPDSSRELYACTTWLGNQLLRVGTWQEISAGAGRSTFPFYWSAFSPTLLVTPISNLPVSPGDVMYAVICFESPTDASIYATNLTTGVYTRFVINIAGLTDSFGNPAEFNDTSAWWILEAPVGGSSESQDDALGGWLPRYADVYFDNCIAGPDNNNNLLFSGAGFFFPMVNTDNQEISIAQADTDRLFTIEYTGEGGSVLAGR